MPRKLAHQSSSREEVRMGWLLFGENPLGIAA
jgi:hypothetical protein